MRSRTNSGVRLDYYHRMIQEIILQHQNPVTGLFPASCDNNHAWVRDNIYTILAVWGLAMAYRKIADMDEDRAKTYELEQSCVKLMRGILMAMLQQKEKVEKFKRSQHPADSLHAKFSSETGQTVVGDSEWGHLQLDAVSLYLLVLGQMTASGLQIIFSHDEVAFVQNLVFYIESAYCTPDYGIWERGDKTNHGLPELNASSIGMAKAALEAMNEHDLFGARGGPMSVIHVLPDEAQKCQAVLQSMLPRESSSKELDSGLLAVISFPAFAVDDPELIQMTRQAIVNKLQGRFGCKRFLRDGHRTPKEDPSRLYYEPWELRMFEHIECEWPLFFCYLALDHCFQGDRKGADYYISHLEKIMLRSDSGTLLVPELYAVPKDKVDAEYKSPGSQSRMALGRCPFLWAQSLYILAKLLQENFLAVGELDPLNRRLCSEKKPDVVVQVVVLAEDEDIKERLGNHDIHVQTVAEVAPIEIQPARMLSHLYTYLGYSEKLGLTGRRSRDVGILATSKLYSLHDRLFAFTPQLTDLTRFYIASDYELMIDIFKSELNFLKSSWQSQLGRPLIVLALRQIHLGTWRDEDGRIPSALLTTMKKLQSGYLNGTRVALGNLSDFINTSSITDLSFLGSQEDGLPDRLNPQVHRYLEQQLHKPLPSRFQLLECQRGAPRAPLRRRMSVKGAIKKTRSIAIEPELMGMSSASMEERRFSSAGLERRSSASGLLRMESSENSTRSPSPDEPMPLWRKNLLNRPRVNSDSYADTEVEELLGMLRETEHLEEQGDILQYLVDTQGLDFNTGLVQDGSPVTVKDLLKVLYEKAGQQKLWGLVRHSAALLGKRVEDLAKAVTDLLVRQKQITVGMPPANEHTITAPLPESELRQVIHQAYGDDESTGMLTQELIVYLAMFIRTEPELFHEMLRLRIGLIIQVMAAELSRTLSCSGEEASEHLLNLSPFEMKNLLHHIISGKEFAISSVTRGTFSVISCISSRISKVLINLILTTGVHGLPVTDFQSHIGSLLGISEGTETTEPDRQGQWLRRRRLDGALNRVPRDFYPRVWGVLERSQGLVIEEKILPQNLTQEMTSNELKFALAVETALNSIPQPEYRQLVVEALMVLTLAIEHQVLASSPPHLLHVQELVHTANELFLQDQMRVKGDATLCCAKNLQERHGEEDASSLLCGGAAGICQHLYDSAPSGSYGSMTYLARAVAATGGLLAVRSGHEVECQIS